MHQHSCLKSTCIVFPFSSVQISSSTVSQISTDLQFCCPDPITEFWSHIWSSTILQLQLQSTPRIHCLKLNPASMASFWVENVSFVHFKKDSCRRKVKFRMNEYKNKVKKNTAKVCREFQKIFKLLSYTLPWSNQSCLMKMFDLLVILDDVSMLGVPSLKIRKIVLDAQVFHMMVAIPKSM